MRHPRPTLRPPARDDQRPLAARREGGDEPRLLQVELHRELTDPALERTDMLRRFDRLFLALKIERQLTSVVFLQPVVHQRGMRPRRRA